MWGSRFEKTYFDMRVFNPHAPLNKHSSLNASYNRHEREIKRTYERDAALLVHTPRPLRHWWVGKRGHNKDWLLSSHANRITTSNNQLAMMQTVFLTPPLLHPQCKRREILKGKQCDYSLSIDLTMEESKLQSEIWTSYYIYVHTSVLTLHNATCMLYTKLKTVI